MAWGLWAICLRAHSDLQRGFGEVLNPCLDRAVDVLECLTHRGVAVAMNEFNVREREESDE